MFNQFKIHKPTFDWKLFNNCSFETFTQVYLFV